VIRSRGDGFRRNAWGIKFRCKKEGRGKVYQDESTSAGISVYRSVFLIGHRFFLAFSSV
jgi:hypothetical protein